MGVGTLSKGTSIKLKFLRRFETRTGYSSPSEVFCIGFTFYLLQETICNDKNSETESSLFFSLKVRLFV